jgi:hypothetical protein
MRYKRSALTVAKDRAILPRIASGKVARPHAEKR